MVSFLVLVALSMLFIDHYALGFDDDEDEDEDDEGFAMVCVKQLGKFFIWRFRLHCWPNLVSYSNINTFSIVMIQKVQLDNRLLMNSYWTHRDSTPLILCWEFAFHVFFNAFSHLIRACSISSQTNNFNQRSVHFFRLWKQQLIYCA